VYLEVKKQFMFVSVCTSQQLKNISPIYLYLMRTQKIEKVTVDNSLLEFLLKKISFEFIW